MTDLPLPLTPPDCDLRGLPFMPLDVIRLLDSDLFAIATGDEFKAAIALWCKSWLQVPAASLPDDDRVLAHLSGSAARWKKIREMALRGFVKCSDGRFYHPIVAEKALDAWGRRGDWQAQQSSKNERQQRWRQRQKGLSEQLRECGITPPKGASLETLERMLVDAGVDITVDAEASTSPSTVDAGEMPKTGTGTGTGTITPIVPVDDATPKGKKREYVFEGLTVRLNQRDFDQWKASYHAIPDLRAALQALDDWLQGPTITDAKRKNWYPTVSALLARKQNEALAKQREEDAAQATFLARHPLQCRPEHEWRALMGDEEFERQRHSLQIAVQ